MLKYIDTKVTFSEIPDEITLCIGITGCKIGCEGCHSSYLAGDVGKVLTYNRIEELLKRNRGVTTICFMGGDNDPKLINHYAKLINRCFRYTRIIAHDSIVGKITLERDDLNPIKIGWYSGRQELSKEIDLNNFSYIKLGPYKKECGPLNCKTTNQRFYQIINGEMVDITNKFWKDETED